MPNTRCFNGALLACDRAHQPEAAIKLIGRMRGRDAAARPDVVSYSTAIAACSRRPTMTERAVQLLRLMQQDGLRPNAVTYGAVAQAYVARAHALTAAAAAAALAPPVHSCTRAASTPPPSSASSTSGTDLVRCVPTPGVCRYAASGAWQEGLQLLGEMERRGVPPNALTLTAVLNGCAAGGAWQPALSIARDMRTRYVVGLKPRWCPTPHRLRACEPIPLYAA